MAKKPKHDLATRAMILLIEKTAQENPEYRKLVDQTIAEAITRRKAKECE